MSDLEPLAKLSNLTHLTLDLAGSQALDFGPLAKLSDLTDLTVNYLGLSRASDLGPLSKLVRLRTLSIEHATREQRMSLRNIPASLVELKF
jgi:hypothetical protein